ncbi:hypothetical protein HYV30_03560 [Candidatus Kaiserbacteria bacterium]|nr:hypothetical protein [Candidatus Kaiserbacteria bacterium]
MDQNNIRVNPGVMSGLAIVGFVSLVGAGVWLAVLGARYVPEIVDRTGLAAIYLGSSLDTPPPGTVATTTPPGAGLGNGSATSTATSTPPRQTPLGGGGYVAGPRTGTNTLISGTTTPVLHGLPDLAITIQEVGYLVGPTTDSFIASTTVPVGGRPAVRFTIHNAGTNSTGSWRFSATIPTQTNFVFQSAPQQSLNPGDRIEYTLGFDQPIPGAGRTITLRANFDNAVVESNTVNNVIFAQLTILGS